MTRGRLMAAALDRLLPAGPLLEVGVGTGLVAAGLTELGRRPVGVDLSRPMLDRAAARIPGRVAIGDAQRLPVRTGAVAGACLVHVLHLVGDAAGTLAEAARVVRPGGRVVTTAYPGVLLGTDVHRELHAVRRRLERVERPDDEAHLTELARGAGLRPEDRHELPGLGVTPRAVADRLESRTLSWMWSVDDAEWAEHVPPALARLRALPDQDRDRPTPGPILLSFAHS